MSFSDSIFLPLVVGRRVTFPAKSDYFTGKGIKGRLTALFFRGVGQIPIDRSGGRASMAALEAGKSLLEQGELFGIYPRAPGPRTAGSTAARPASRGWRSRPALRSSPSR